MTTTNYDNDVQQIYKAFENSERHEICVAFKHDGVLITTLPIGSMRKHCKVFTCEEPTAYSKCDGNKLHPQRHNMHIEEQQKLFIRMHYDTLILQHFNLTCQSISLKIYAVIVEMKKLCLQGKGKRVQYTAEKCLSLRYPQKFKLSKWTGVNFSEILPELKKNWSIVDKEEAIISNNYRVSLILFQGAEECPFQDPSDPTYFGYQYGNKDYVIEDLLTKEKFAISSLTVHMIHSHNCFQASKNKYRIHPRKLIRILFRK